MKNTHVIPTDKPSSLVLDTINNNLFLTTTKDFGTKIMQFQNIYITSDEKIKEGDWMYYKHFGEDIICEYDTMGGQNTNVNEHKDYYKKIILTTDQDLIKDGVQAIDDEFLQWFVKNPLCEEAEVVDLYGYPNVIHTSYKMVIPKEEPKQETLEEAAEKIYPNAGYDDEMWCDSGELFREKFIEGAKWQQERMYSEEDMINFAEFVTGYPDKNRNQFGQILHAKSRYDGAERTSDLLMIWADLGRTAKDQTV